MTVKHVLLVALVLANMLLVTAVTLHLTNPPAAQGQVVAGAMNYVALTAGFGNDHALWVLDLNTRKLFVMRRPAGALVNMEVLDGRDLARDLRSDVKAKTP